MARTRFAALALLVAVVAIAAVHADWDDGPEFDDHPCWGCAAGSCVDVPLNTGKYQMCHQHFASFIRQSPKSFKCILDYTVAGRKLSSIPAGRKLMREDDDHDDWDDHDDDDDWARGTRRMCTQCAIGYSLERERAYGGVTAGECGGCYSCRVNGRQMRIISTAWLLIHCHFVA